MTIVLFIVILAILILTHEFGHFVTAKLFKIRVDEFGLGLPPRLWGFKFGETLYSLNILPLGGFVKIFGEDPNEENINGPDKERSFVNKAKWQQSIVLVAGVTLNLVLAWILISINLGLGMPVGLEGIPRGLKINQEALSVISILPNSPASQAGLMVGDQLLSLSTKQQKITQVDLSSKAVQNFVKQFPDQSIEIEYKRQEKVSKLSVKPQLGLVTDGEVAIGLATQKIGLVSAPWWQTPFWGLIFTGQLILSTIFAFGTFFVSIFSSGKEALGAIAGPVGIYGLVGDASRLGFVYLLNFTALISINLAVLNLLPFPALDGGRLLFVAIEAIIRRPIKPIIANTLNTIGFALLLLLMVIIAVSDVFKLL